MMSTADRMRALAEAERRQWPKVVDLPDELEAEAAEAAQTFIDAIERLRSAVDDKESAMDEAPSDRADSLAQAWDEVTEALTEAAEAIDVLTGLDS